MRRTFHAAAGFALLATAPALAEPLNAEQARAFVVGRYFAFTCFEGTTGSGRILPDGSVAGMINLSTQPGPRYVRLPPNTLRVRGENVCGFIQGMTFEPCFSVTKTGPNSFRGTLAGFDGMWCEFNRTTGDRSQVASRRNRKPAAEAASE